MEGLRSSEFRAIGSRCAPPIQGIGDPRSWDATATVLWVLPETETLHPKPYSLNSANPGSRLLSKEFFFGISRTRARFRV